MDPAEFMIATAGSFVSSADGRTVSAGELAAYYASSKQGVALREMIKALERSYVSRTPSAPDSVSAANSSGSDTGSRGNSAVTVSAATISGGEPSSVRHQLRTLLGRRWLVMQRKWKYYMWIFSW
jgi:hypothetical protein